VSKIFTKDLKLKGLIGAVHDRSALVPMASDFGLYFLHGPLLLVFYERFLSTRATA